MSYTRFYTMAVHDASEPLCDWQKTSTDIPVPALEHILLDPEFVRVTIITGTMEINITCEDVPDKEQT